MAASSFGEDKSSNHPFFSDVYTL